MPEGILIDLKDGGPAMAITANLRCPSFGVEFAGTAGEAKSKAIPGFVSGSTVIYLPKESAMYDDIQGVAFVLDSVTVSGSTVSQNIFKSNSSARDFNFPMKGSVWQVLPVKSGQGLLVASSTDFLSITDNTMVGACIWRGTVSIPTGGWSTPAVAGYDRSKYLVFAKWDSTAVVDFDGGTVRAYQDQSGDDHPVAVTMDVAIFASGVAPVPGNGLNIINAQGKCVFSTTKRPFIYDGSAWTPSTSATAISGHFAMLGRFGFMSTAYKDLYYLKYAGLKMSGGKLNCAAGKVMAHTDREITNNRLSSVSVPLLPAMY